MGSNSVEDVCELSPLQQGILLHSLQDGAADMYLAQQVYQADGPLDLDALAGAWQSVVDAQPGLRASFDWADGLAKPLQLVWRHAALPVRTLDWTNRPPAEHDGALDQLLAQDQAVGFNLARPGQQRLHLIRYAPEVTCLVWTYHHIAIDGWSVALIMDDVLAHYHHRLAGGPLPPARPPFRDYIAWLQRQDDDAAEDYWRHALEGAGPSRLGPLHPAQPTDATGEVERRLATLPDAVAADLRAATERHRVTFGTLAAAAWAVVLSRLSGRDDVIFGQPVSGRPLDLPHAGAMVGMFANTLPVRVQVDADAEVGDWLRALQTRNARMRRHETTPLSSIQGWAGVPGRQLFDTLLNIETVIPVKAAPEDPVSLGRLRLHDKISMPVVITIAPPPRAEINLLVHTGRFDPGFTDELLARVVDTLGAIATAARVGAVVEAAGAVVPARSPDPGPAGPLPAPNPEVETRVVKVYRDVLGIAEVDPAASFFDLGGDSFSAVRAAGRIDGASVGLLARHPSARALAAALGDAPTPDGGPDDAGPMVPVPRTEGMEPMVQQAGLWFATQLAPTSTSYHIPTSFRVRGPLDRAALERALTRLVGRHESLRSRFEDRAGVPRLVIDPAPGSVTVEVDDVSRVGAAEWTIQQCARPFDLAAGPLLRVRLARLGPQDHVLVVVAHHTIADGWSMRILAEELTAGYTEARADAEVGRPPLPIQPADVAVWQRRWLASAEGERAVGYWRRTLDRLPTLDLPTDRPRSATPTYGGDQVGLVLPGAVGQAAHAFAREHGLSLLSVLQAAVLVTLHRHTGQADIPLGSLFAARSRPEVEPLIGYFGNSVVLRTPVQPDRSFFDLARRCHTTVLEATQHQDVPFPTVVGQLNPPRVPGRHPLFQVDLTLLPRGLGDGTLVLDGTRLSPMPDEDHYCQFDLGFEFGALDGDNLVLGLEYATDLFDRATVRRLARHFTHALRQGPAHPDTPVEQLHIMSARSRSRLARRPARPPAPPARVITGGAGRPVDRDADARAAAVLADARELLGHHALKDTDDFFDHGADSLFTLQLVARLGPGLGATVHPDRVLSHPTARGLAAALRPGPAAVPVPLGHPVRRPGPVGQLLRGVGRELGLRLLAQPRVLRLVRGGRDRWYALNRRLDGVA